MTTRSNESSRPRTLTDAVRAHQARQHAGTGAGGRPRVRGASAEKPGRVAAESRSHSAPRSAPTRPKRSSENSTAPERRDGGGESWLSRLLTPLKKWGHKLLDALEGLLGEHSSGLGKFGALLAAGMLAKRLPGPLGSLARTLIAGLKGDRGFAFWALVVALVVLAILAILLLPVVALIALLVVGIWLLVHRDRDEDEDQDGSQGDSGERESPSEPGMASSGS